jgi:putative flippase GtrA
MVQDQAESAIGAGGAPPTRKHRRLALRFSKYSALSLIIVPVGYTLLLVATQLFPDVNAGLLNLALGTVLTPPSFLLYRFVVWKGGGRTVWAELFSFWQTVMVGAIASSVLIGAADAIFDAGGPLIILAGLTGQGLIFLARFIWLDKVTFARPEAVPDSVANGD